MSVPSAPILTPLPIVNGSTIEYSFSPGARTSSFLISCWNGSNGASTILPSTAFSFTFSNLFIGQFYTGTIRGCNANGAGPSVSYYPMQPGFAPSVPLNVNFSQTVDYSSITVTWSTPANLGGASVNWYGMNLNNSNSAYS